MGEQEEHQQAHPLAARGLIGAFVRSMTAGLEPVSLPVVMHFFARPGHGALASKAGCRGMVSNAIELAV